MAGESANEILQTIQPAITLLGLGIGAALVSRASSDAAAGLTLLESPALAAAEVAAQRRHKHDFYLDYIARPDVKAYDQKIFDALPPDRNRGGFRPHHSRRYP